MRVVFVVVGVLLGQPDEQGPVLSDFDGAPSIVWSPSGDAGACNVRFRHWDDHRGAAVLVGVPEVLGGTSDAHVILVREAGPWWRVNRAPLSWFDRHDPDLGMPAVKRETLGYLCGWLWRFVSAEVPR